VKWYQHLPNIRLLSKEKEQKEDYSRALTWKRTPALFLVFVFGRQTSSISQTTATKIISSNPTPEAAPRDGGTEESPTSRLLSRALAPLLAIVFHVKLISGHGHQGPGARPQLKLQH